MRVFRKRKKFGNFGGKADEAPLPDIVYQMGAESAARYVASRSASPNPYAPIDPFGQEAIYGYPVAVEDNYEDDFSSSNPLRAVASAFRLGRSKSRERRSSRPTDRYVGNGSPVHFAEQPLGSPVKFRRRPGSPGMIQPRAGSPYHFAGQERIASPFHFAAPERPSSPLQFAHRSRPSSPLQFAHRSRPGSPDVIRRLQRAQLSQDLQHLERQQRREQELMMMNPVQFAPQYPPVQQPYYPMGNGYQPQMFSYY